jgi:hypothetical protein
MYTLIQEGGAGDSSEFLNESGEGMEIEWPHEAKTKSEKLHNRSVYSWLYPDFF